MGRGIYARPSAAARFAAKTRREAGARVPELGPCLVWTGALSGDSPTSTGGYGLFFVAGKMVQAHRWSYEHARGPIPPGLHPDHLCRNRACVDPSHLELVTVAENNRRRAPYVVTGGRRFSRADAAR